jgi:AAA family ATP:ADP antiporter
MTDGPRDEGQHRLTSLEGILRRFVDVRADEVRALVIGFVFFFFLLCSYFVLRPLRDAMGLVGGVGDYPWLFTATFVTMLLAVPAFGMLVARLPPLRFVPLLYRFFALNILLFGALFALRWQELYVGRTFFVWLSVFNLFVVSVFWSVLVDVFRNEQGRRLFGFIAAGGTLGSLVGPALTAVLVERFGPAALALVAAALLEAAVRCVRVLAASVPREGRDAERAAAAAQERVGGGAWAGLLLIVRQPYLAGIAVYMLLYTMTSTLLYVEQGRIVATAFADTAARARFFATIDIAVGALTLLSQLILTAPVIQRLGVAFVLATLPLVSAVAFVAVAIWPTLAVLTIAQSVRRAVEFAFAKPGREILFTVVDRESKYKAKNAIDTFVYRGGDAASGWVSAGLVAMGLSFTGIAGIMLPFVAGWLALSLWLGGRQDTAAGRTQERAEAA